MKHKIVSYTLTMPRNGRLEYEVQHVVDDWSRMRSRGSGEYLLSSLRARTDQEAAALAAIGCEEQDHTVEYQIGWTPAPVAYDHGFTIQLDERDGRRLVAVPHEDVEAQCGRYASGCYGLSLEPE